MNEILQVATFLDPRFKVKYFEHVQEVELMSIKQKVTDDALEVCHELQEVQQNSSRAESSRTQEVAHSSLQPSAPKKKRNLGTLFKDFEFRIREQEQEHASPVNQEEQHRQIVMKEIDGYLSGHRLDFEEDPLMWWKRQQFNFPVLAKLAQKYLCVCATSSASERLFSTAGNVVSPFRATMKPDKVDMLVFLSKNL